MDEKKFDIGAEVRAKLLGRVQNEAFHALKDEVYPELAEALSNWPPMNSAHEGFAVLAEEVEELWAHVRTKQHARSLPTMRKEAIQVAAMAVRFALEVCSEERGRR